MSVDLDHTSFAVHDAAGWARRLRSELGAVPVVGEVLPEFRYVMLYVGTADQGGRIELLEPVNEGFLTRFLADRGEGPHHITYTVPDLEAVVRDIRALGLTVVGESYDHASWQEAFIMPDAVHGTVIQIASSDHDYPTPEELLASQHRDPDLYPASKGATQPLWWSAVWETDVENAARLGAPHLASTDLALSRRLFEGVLGGRVNETPQGVRFTWPSGSVQVVPGEEPGVFAMELDGGPPNGVTIGAVRLAREL